MIREIDGERWLATGDIGKLVQGRNGKPFLKITDRKKELLKTSGGKRMDAVMQEHMKFAQFKTIDYKVLELTPKAGAAGQYEAKGALTVAGVTRTNAMPVTIERVDKKLKVTGTASLKMTDHGIKPPAPDIAGISLIRTGDDVKLKFEWVTEPKAP